MSEPSARRPFMPGYGIAGPEEGSGLLPWSWAEERLEKSHDYWLATVWPDGRPHVMPVWGVWDGGFLWLSSSVGSRKARNLRLEQRCVITTDNPIEPVVLEGTADMITDERMIAAMVASVNQKYSTDVTLEFMNPDRNATFRFRPRWGFGLDDKDFTGSPTRWDFEGSKEA